MAQHGKLEPIHHTDIPNHTVMTMANTSQTLALPNIYTKDRLSCSMCDFDVVYMVRLPARRGARQEHTNTEVLFYVGFGVSLNWPNGSTPRAQQNRNFVLL